MKEKALLLGDNDSMLGILSEPDVAPDPQLPLFVVLNAGIVHRIGPHRKSVMLTRSLAEAGFRALRFDLSGIGDSPARRDSLRFDESALADVGEVLDDLEARYGSKRFVLMGLCSGADNSLYAAIADERIVGAIMLDGVAYRTPRYYLHRYGPRMRRLGFWRTVGKRVVHEIRARIPSAAAEAGDPSEEELVADAAAAASALEPYIREFEPQEVVARKLQALVDRGVQTYWIYTSGMLAYYSYRKQFHDIFKDVDFKGKVAHEYFKDSNHTFTELRSQRALVDAVVRWASRSFPEQPASAA